MVVRKIKEKVRCLFCLNIIHQDGPKIVEINASDIRYGGIWKQKIDDKKNLIRFTFGTWNDIQKNYSTIKKILTIVKVILKFQGDLLNQ